MRKNIKFLLLFIICLAGAANAQPAIIFNTKTDFTTGLSPRSVSIGDLNGDGLPDLAVANINSTSISVFLNLTTPGSSTPSFSSKTDFTTGTNPISVSIGDLNGDGKPDLVAANLISNTVSVFLNLTTPGSSTPSFSSKTDFTTGTNPISVSIGDLNGDGLPDLAVANISSNSVSVFLNFTTPGSSTPSFSSKTDFTTGTSPISVSIGDLNGDGLPDLAVTNANSASVSVFLNTTTPGSSTPSFSSKTDFTTGTTPYSVSIGDLNGDGKPDLAVSNFSSNSVSVFLNLTTPGSSTPSFSSKTDFTTGTNPRSVSIGDLNGDGKPDLAVANISSSSVSVFSNLTTPGATTPSFSSKTDFTTGTDPTSVSIGDLNGDGLPDLVVTNEGSISVSVLFNTTNTGTPATSFNTKTDFTTGTTPQSVSIGDLNGDGLPDLAVANINSASVSVFLNLTTPGASTPTFSSKTDFTTGSGPISVSIGDLNGDGLPDLVAANISSSTVSVFLNLTTPGSSTPSFSSKFDFTTAFGPWPVSIEDLNGDGKPDLAVVNENSVSVLLNTTTPGASTPTFSAKYDFITASASRTVSVEDLNGDGMPDLVVANVFSNSVSVFLNLTTPGSSTPSFSSKTDFTTGTSPLSVSISDLNGDGKPDLAVANSNSVSVSVFLNTTTPGATTPSFSSKTDFTTGTIPYSVSIGDLNGDGVPDLAVANANSNSVSVFLNLTTPGASAPSFSSKTDFTTGTAPHSVSIGDLNGDGKSDLAVANFSSNSVSVLLNGFTPLPVELTSFSAFVEDSNVNLIWETATEVNNYGFEILRQAQDDEWGVLGFVEGNGNSNSPKEYSFIDDKVVSGKYSYRLKQIDNDGVYEYSKIIEIDVDAPMEFELSQNYPNPFNPTTTIKFSLPVTSNVNLAVFNILGEEVQILINETIEAGVHIINFNASQLSSGMYVYKLQAANFVETKKMVLMK